MWICTTKAFLSIVEDWNEPNLLIVRARAAGHIEEVFPAAAVEYTPSADYAFRTRVSRKQLVLSITGEIYGIDYPNFKNSVADQELHDAYAEFWKIMRRLQLVATK